MNVRMRQLATTGLSTLALLATTAMTAHAANPARSESVAKDDTCVGDTSIAIACFQPDGDHIHVTDAKVDGLRPVVHWETDYGRYGECTYTGQDTWTDCNYNMAEGRSITFILYLRDASGEIVDDLGGDRAII